MSLYAPTDDGFDDDGGIEVQDFQRLLAVLLDQNNPEAIPEQMVVNVFKRGFDFNKQNIKGWTSLHEVMARFHEDNQQAVVTTVVKLLELGANRKVVEENGSTPLHFLMTKACPSTIDLVLAIVFAFVEHGADLNAQDKWRQTSSHVLMQNEWETGPSLPLVTQLVELGANPNIADEEYGTLLHYLIHWISPTNFDSIFQTIPKLVEYGADMNAIDPRGFTILHILMKHDLRCSTEQFLKFVSELLLLGANPNIINEGKRTPLHYLLRQINRLIHQVKLQFFRQSLVQFFFWIKVKRTQKWRGPHLFVSHLSSSSSSHFFLYESKRSVEVFFGDLINHVFLGTTSLFLLVYTEDLFPLVGNNIQTKSWGLTCPFLRWIPTY